MAPGRRPDSTSQIWLGGLVFIVAVVLVLAASGCNMAGNSIGLADMRRDAGWRQIG